MKILHLKHSEIDKKKWDENLQNCHNALIYANSFYLDVVSPQWEALVTEDYSALFPLPVKRKFILKYLAHPLFAQQLGLFCTEDGLSHGMDFIKEMNLSFRRYQLRLNNSNTFLEENQIERRNFILHIKTEEEVDKAYNQNTKRNLKKAHDYNLEFKKEVTSSEFLELKKSSSRASLSEDEWFRMHLLIDVILQRKLGFFIGVRGSNSISAAVFFTKWKNRICYLFSASNEEGMERRASFAIVDKVIKNHLDSGFILDFEGSMDDNIARFFKGFGAKEEMYFEVKRSF